MKAFQNASRWDARAEVAPWLVRIAVNQSIDQYRRVRRRRTAEEPLAEGDHPATLAVDGRRARPPGAGARDRRADPGRAPGPARPPARGLRAAALRGDDPGGDRGEPADEPGDGEERAAPRGARACGRRWKGCAREVAPRPVAARREPARRGRATRGGAGGGRAPCRLLRGVRGRPGRAARDPRRGRRGRGLRGRASRGRGMAAGPGPCAPGCGGRRAAAAVPPRGLGRRPRHRGGGRGGDDPLEARPGAARPEPRRRGGGRGAGDRGFRRSAGAHGEDDGPRAHGALSRRGAGRAGDGVRRAAPLRSRRPSTSTWATRRAAAASCWPAAPSLDLDGSAALTAGPVLDDVEKVLREVASLENCARRRDVEAIHRHVERERLLMKMELMTRELAG